MQPLTSVACVKISPDTAQLRADPRTGEPRLADAPRRISTFDENALEEAVRLKERHGGKVVALSLVAGSPPAELVLRILAMGADEAVLVEEATAAEADALASASVLAAALRRLAPWDLILCGEGSLDDYSRQVGPRVAEALGVPALTHVTRLEVRDHGVRAHRSLADRSVVVESPRPVLLTVGQELNRARFPTVLQIMGASKKPTHHWTLGELGFARDETVRAMAAVRTVETHAPRSERERAVVQGETPQQVAAELARHLFERGLVKIE